ncbi:Anthocyanidin 3-O-glucosyltransferase [Nymphaea thermarum]|nr:Anthocyanidin 3-O-glucosyltransferase [Nymphaea thermarum]
MLPWLGFGHICPFIQLSNRLVENGVTVTFLSPPTLVERIRAGLDPSIPIVNYDLPPIPGLPAGVESTTASVSARLRLLLMEALDASEPQITNILRKLSPEVIIFDFVYHWLPPLANSLGIKPVFFYVAAAISSTPMKIFTVVHPKKLALTLSENLPVRLVSAITSLKPYEARDMMQNLRRHHKSRRSPCTRMLAVMALSSEIIIKSAVEIEETYIKFFSSLTGKQALPCGTLMSKPPRGELEERWQKWLNKFPVGSVVFCSFGSEVCLTNEQIVELIAGLEMSGAPFFAVLNFRTPGEHAAKQEIVGERMGGKGMVHSGWVQQPHILRHPSVGVHLSHGGFGTIMEAVAGGCQTVLLPQISDQFLCEKLMAKKLKAGVAVKRRSKDGWFTREAVCEAVRMVIDNDEEKTKKIRANNAKLREFLLNESVQQEYITTVLGKLQELVLS